MSAWHRLPTREVEKVWGRRNLPQPFAAGAGQRIGEIWFEPLPPCEGLLAKYLFTSEKLSVQVHPGDADAPEGMSGKEECWLVLDAKPGAKLAVGFEREVDRETMRAAALDGSIEGMLSWFEVKRGDFFYIPAGTVHAIGPGISLVEIQQNSDITYRLFDYGRPRELHLDAALAVAEGCPHDASLRSKLDFGQSRRLVDGPKFSLDYVVGGDAPGIAGPCLVMPLAGSVAVGSQVVEAGDCAALDDFADAVLAPGASALVAASLA
ncbi:class I mannose-6-phosphate isomerase [Erythrobacter sp. HKB08]|uniref:class I mannose-6-phosphate isomerase n=1 Tax=Erythrobacter sp. HKB08 TaxID=2502843 RepID=UPI00100915DD|nr:class I mannose-6-phosphate isomerase [Erythrobacter sp. HKB08]